MLNTFMSDITAIREESSYLEISIKELKKSKDPKSLLKQELENLTNKKKEFETKIQESKQNQQSYHLKIDSLKWDIE